MPLYRITIGPRDAPRLAFEAVAESSARAFAQHADLALPGEAVRITAAAHHCPSGYVECVDGCAFPDSCPNWDASAVEVLAQHVALNPDPEAWAKQLRADARAVDTYRRRAAESAP